MDKIRITGGVRLKGRIQISGAKNAALPLMCASLLTEDTLVLSNVPYLADITTMASLLAQHGVTLSLPSPLMGEGQGGGDGNRKSPPSPTLPHKGGGRLLSLCAADINNFTAPYDLVRTMRASVLVLGPLLARFGQAKVSLPGGCAIGTRPIDMHLKALEQMGAHIELADGYIHAHTHGRLQGATIDFDKVSVGATENIVMAAALADGTTIINHAAREPEVCDLAQCLVRMGAKIDGIGTSTLTIEGMKALHGAEHSVIVDRIETGTFAAAAAITGGDVELVGARADLLPSVIDVFKNIGIEILPMENGLRVRSQQNNLQAVDISTAPYPDFPTDMQAQIMALLTVAKGTSHITETIFENRFMHVPELARMGADIVVNGSHAEVHGVETLKGAEVMATDLRASVSLVIAALAAQGQTLIHRVYHLDRGYERLEEKLLACGAKIERLSDRKPPKVKAA